MLEFRTQISDGGRIIIPAKCRKALNLAIGDEVIIKVVNDEAHIYSVQHALKQAQEFLKKKNKRKLNLTDMLLKERRAEAKNE